MREMSSFAWVPAFSSDSCSGAGQWLGALADRCLYFFSVPPVLALRANCSICPALRMAATESVSLWSCLLRFSGLSPSSAGQNTVWRPPPCSHLQPRLAAERVVAPIVWSGRSRWRRGLGPGGLIAGRGNDSCAWVRMSPTPVATTSAATHQENSASAPGFAAGVSSSLFRC